MLRSVKLASVILVSLIVACSDNTGPVSLGLNRVRWEKQNLHDYVYTAWRGCFCTDSGQDAFVSVLSDTVFSVRLVATGVEVPKAGWHTVPQLFEIVDRSFGESYTSIFIAFDPDLGYPTRIRLVCADIPDCGLTIEAKNLNRIGFLD